MTLEPHYLPPGWKRDLTIERCGLRPAIRRGLVLSESGGALIVRDSDSGARRTMTPAQTAVFVRANGSRTFQEIVGHLAAARSFGPLGADAAVHRILCALIEDGLLVLRRLAGP